MIFPEINFVVGISCVDIFFELYCLQKKKSQIAEFVGKTHQSFSSSVWSSRFSWSLRSVCLLSAFSCCWDMVWISRHVSSIFFCLVFWKYFLIMLKNTFFYARLFDTCMLCLFIEYWPFQVLRKFVWRLQWYAKKLIFTFSRFSAITFEVLIFLLK